jgi:uncharacterized protein
MDVHLPAAPTPASPELKRRGRSPALDATRAVALLGVIVVNAPFFAGVPAGPLGTLDALAVGFVQTFAAAKFFPIFSFLFGFGFARLLDETSAGTEALTRRRFLRRLMGLGALGCVHAAFFFHGDILMLYAVLGIGLWFARNWSARRLLLVGAGLLMLGVVIQAVALRELDLHAMRIEALAVGSEVPPSPFWETLVFVLAFNGPVAAAMFLFGRAAGREGWFSPEGAWPRARTGWVAGAGTLAALVSGGALLWTRDEGAGAYAWLVYALAAPVMAMAMLHGIFALARSAGHAAWVRVLASTGGSTLSGYLGHSVILGTLFNAWGLDWSGRLGPTALLGVALGVFAVIVVALHLWRTRFGRGPAEVALGWWTRLGEASPGKT